MLIFLLVLIAIAFLPQIIENGCLLLAVALALLFIAVILGSIALIVCQVFGITI